MRPSRSTPFATIVRALRRTRGLTQEGLARELAVTFSTVNGWENGKHQPIPSLRRRVEEIARSTTDRDVGGASLAPTLKRPGRPPAERHRAAVVRARKPSGVRLEPKVTASRVQRDSGWEPDARERLDFFHTVRAFPPDVLAWRQEMLRRIISDRTLFPRTPRGDDTAARAKLDAGISRVREIARILSVLHGTPRLGNHDDPVDELVYIVLSRRTRERAYQETFTALKNRFATWDGLLDAGEAEVKKLVRAGGLVERKTRCLFGALSRLRDEFGACTLDPVRSWPDARIEAFLCSLPEIERKSAYCIMMYSLGRPMFPVDTHVGRVLSRLGLYPELGLRLAGLDHRKLQRVLADAVPPNLRYSLHVNLVEHGRRVCRPARPRCDSCDLKGFCQDFRKREASRVASSGAPTFVDLFCGAGGLSEGFESAGFRPLLAVDLDPESLKTYAFNHPSTPAERVVCGDARELAGSRIGSLIGRARVDVLIGAPPCQGYSHAGARARASRTGYEVGEDSRNFLFRAMIDAAVRLKPRLFLMENVPGMSTARQGDLSFIDRARRAMDRAGYTTDIWRLNACSFGVPQDRARIFLVAARDGRLPPRPVEEYRDQASRGYDVDALPPITLDEATLDLPPLDAGSGRMVSTNGGADAATPRNARRYLDKFGLRTSPRLLFGHAVRHHNERDIELYGLLQPGENSVHALERYGRRDLMRYRTDAFDDKYHRLRPNRPCKTIVSHLAKDGNGYIHPHQARSLTFREAARVQSFRDDYVFCGAASDQWTQLGNAVPPLLARAIATAFLGTLRQRGPR